MCRCRACEGEGSVQVSPVQTQWNSEAPGRCRDTRSALSATASRTHSILYVSICSTVSSENLLSYNVQSVRCLKLPADFLFIQMNVMRAANKKLKGMMKTVKIKDSDVHHIASSHLS
jgi:hypothetical protein